MCKFSTTLKTLRKNLACYNGYNKLVRSLQGNPCMEEDYYRASYIRFRHEEEIPILYILESNGLDDALWSLRCVANVDRDARLFAVWCASQVKHLMKDSRSLDALIVAERFANGEASSEDMEAARTAAKDAWFAARAALLAPVAAAWAAKPVTLVVASDAAFRTALRSVSAASTAALVADGFINAAMARAAKDAAKSAQKEMFIQMCNGTAPWQTKE